MIFCYALYLYFCIKCLYFFKIRGGAFIVNNVVTFKILKHEQIKKKKNYTEL